MFVRTPQLCIRSNTFGPMMHPGGTDAVIVRPHLLPKRRVEMVS